MSFTLWDISGVVLLVCLMAVVQSADELIHESSADNSKDKNDGREEEKTERRDKRQIPLVYPFGGTYKLLIGFALPIPNDDHISLVFAANFQYQYLQIQNISSVSQYYSFMTVSRGERALDDASLRQNERIVFYRATEEMLSSKGFNGHECMLRAVCEAAQYPVDEEGLVGEILHILLTPDYGRSQLEVQDDAWWTEYEDLMSEYLSARTAGAQMFHCASLYGGCPDGQGVLELISQLRDD